MKSTMLIYKNLLFKKSLWKDYIRRQIPIPYSTNLNYPIFVIGSSRSGTTILAKVIGNFPNVCPFTENNIVRRHMWRMTENKVEPEQEVVELEKTIARLSNVSDQERILEKTPGHSLIAKPLADYFVDAKFVHIVRDGRDVAFSMLGHSWISKELQEKHKVFWFRLLPQQFQQQWQKLDLWERGVLRWAVYVSQARQIAGYDDRYLEIKYEELCRHPQVCLKGILSFLELPVFSELQKYSASIKPSSSNWNNKGLTTNQLEFYKRVISEFDMSDVVCHSQ